MGPLSHASAALQAPRLADSKAPEAYRTISEVATTLDVPQHVLRFWESKFQQIRPLKRGGGRRYYRPEDVTLLSNIKELLYSQGFTIRGVQKLLKETGRAGIVRPSSSGFSMTRPSSAEAEDGALSSAPVAQPRSSGTVDAAEGDRTEGAGSGSGPAAPAFEAAALDAQLALSAVLSEDAAPHLAQAVTQRLAAATLAAPSQGLTAAARREMEAILSDLKTMRDWLGQVGV